MYSALFKGNGFQFPVSIGRIVTKYKDPSFMLCCLPSINWLYMSPSCQSSELYILQWLATSVSLSLLPHLIQNKANHNLRIMSKHPIMSSMPGIQLLGKWRKCSGSALFPQGIVLIYSHCWVTYTEVFNTVDPINKLVSGYKPTWLLRCSLTGEWAN